MTSSVVVLGLAAFLYGGPNGYEEPKFAVVADHADFEVRRYAPRLVAHTTVDGNFDEAGSAAFRRLAEYISGQNEEAADIAMTIPVTQSPLEKKLAPNADLCRAPVGTTADAYRLEFGMPSYLDYDRLPRPTDDRVKIEMIPSKTFAVIAYRGDWDRDRYERHEAELLAALDREGLVPVGAPQWARYSSPLMIWFLKRNEILIEVEEARAKAKTTRTLT